MSLSSRWRLKETESAFAFFPIALPITVEKLDLEMLVDYSSRTKKNGRLCLHLKETDLVHHMILCEWQGKIYPPHRHLNDSECFTIIEGKLGLVEYTDGGSILHATVLTAGSFHKASIGQFHSVFPLTQPVVYNETKGGPYKPLRESLPQWYPTDFDGQLRHDLVIKELFSDLKSTEQKYGRN